MLKNISATPFVLLTLVALVAATDADVPPFHRIAVASGAPRTGTARRNLLARNTTKAATGGSRIAYGTIARPGQFPYATKIWLYVEDGTYNCGGAMIGPKLILTAAHCVVDDDGELYDPRNFELAVGVTDLSDPDVYTYAAKRIIIPAYNPTTMWGDIALIELNEFIAQPMSGPIPKAIALPTYSAIKAGWRLTVMGWGESTKNDLEDKLSYVTLTSSSAATCAKRHSSYGLGRLPADHFCTAPHRTGKISCPGDSGGPFVYKPTSTSRPVIIGLVSYSPNDYECGEIGNLEVITSVVFWRRWIASMILKYKL